MTEIERAIDIISTYNNTIAVNPDFECAMDTAIAALREQAEREKGCVWCKGDWTDNFTVIDENFCQPLTYRHVKYCPMCGKRLEVKHEDD